MALVLLERLRPQINAITSQYENIDLFIQSLESLLINYKGEVDISSSQIYPYSLIPKLNVPPIVLNQLEISLKHLALKYPQQTKTIAEVIWGKRFFEYKRIALFIASNLSESENNWYFGKLAIWLNEETEVPIFDVVLNIAKKNEIILTSDKWISLIESWLYSKKNRLIKLGLAATSDLVRNHPTNNLPEVFQLIEPVFINPNISINSDLIKIIKALASRSEAETAAFIIHLGTLYPKPELFAIIRRCLPIFDENYASEIAKTIM